MKITVTKEELLDLCSRCAEKSLKYDCDDACIFGADCKQAYIDFLRDNTEVISDDGKTRI